MDNTTNTDLLGHAMDRIESAERRINWQAKQIAEMRDQLAMQARRLQTMEHTIAQHDGLLGIIDAPVANETRPYIRMVSAR